VCTSHITAVRRGRGSYTVRNLPSVHRRPACLVHGYTPPRTTLTRASSQASYYECSRIDFDFGFDIRAHSARFDASESLLRGLGRYNYSLAFVEDLKGKVLLGICSRADVSSPAALRTLIWTSNFEPWSLQPFG